MPTSSDCALNAAGDRLDAPFASSPQPEEFAATGDWSRRNANCVLHSGTVEPGSETVQTGTGCDLWDSRPQASHGSWFSSAPWLGPSLRYSSGSASTGMSFTGGWAVRRRVCAVGWFSTRSPSWHPLCADTEVKLSVCRVEGSLDSNRGGVGSGASVDSFDVAYLRQVVVASYFQRRCWSGQAWGVSRHATCSDTLTRSLWLSNQRPHRPAVEIVSWPALSKYASGPRSGAPLRNRSGHHPPNSLLGGGQRRGEVGNLPT